MSLIRALLTWLAVFVLLTLLTSMLGGVGKYELVLLLVVSVGLTALFLRLWDRRHPTGARDTPSS